MRDPCGDGIVLYLDCININILVVIFYCSFTIYYHGRKLGKATRDLSELFLTTVCISTIISSKMIKNMVLQKSWLLISLSK